MSTAPTGPERAAGRGMTTTIGRMIASVGLAVGMFGPAAAQQPGELVSRAELRVCADPNDLPFSNDQGEGYENKTAEILGKELKLPVRFVYFPQVIGFVRNTLGAYRCDLVTGTVAGDEIVQTTTPYYYSGYFAAWPHNKPYSFTGFDDPRLKTMRIGIISATPPSDLLVRHGLMANAEPYALMVDTRYASPARQMLEDVNAGKLDLALVWGPIAGYYIKLEKLDLAVAPLPDEPGAPRMDYHIAMGVRANEPEWRRRINAAIHQRQSEITAVLQEFGVPLLDEQGHLIAQP